MIKKKFRTFWPRFWAGFIDMNVFWPLSLLDKWIWNTFDKPRVLLLLWYISFSTAGLIYSIILHSLYGQTLGKMLLKIKVLNISEDKLRMSQAIKRDAIPLVLVFLPIAIYGPKILHGMNPQQPVFFSGNVFAFYLTLFTGFGWLLIELITMFTNKKRRAVHDYIAGSVVVKTETVAPSKSWIASFTILIIIILIAVNLYKGIYQKLHDVDHSRTSKNILTFLKPDKEYPFIGFWKKNCKESNGLAFDKIKDGKYSISYCRPTGCSPETYYTNTSLINDPNYRIINENIIELATPGGYWRYYRCGP